MNNLHHKNTVLAFVLRAETLEVLDASHGDLNLVLSLPRQIRGIPLDAPRVAGLLARGLRPARLHFSPNPALAKTPRAIALRETLRTVARELSARNTEDARLFQRLEDPNSRIYGE